MKKRSFFLIVIIPLLFITGCWDSRPIDELGFIANLTIEKTDSDDKIKMNIIRPTSDEEKKEFSHKTTVEGKTVMEGLNELQKHGSKTYVLGSVLSVFIGKKIASKGVNSLLSELDHISDFKPQAILSVFNGTIEEIEEFDPPQQQRIGILINDSLVTSIRNQQIPSTRFYEVMIIHTLEGRDIVLPIIKIDTENENILVERLAVFSLDKMVGSLSIEEGIPFMIITLPKVNEIVVNIPSEETKQYGIEKLSIVIRKKKVNIKTKIEEGLPIIDASFTLTIDQLDFVTNNSSNIEQYKTFMDKESVIKSIETSVSNYLEKETKKLVKQTQQEFKSDIFGFGEKVRVQNNEYFKSTNWRDVYPEAKVTCTFKVTLRELGAIK